MDWWTLATYYKNFLLSGMSPKGDGDRAASQSLTPLLSARCQLLIHTRACGVKHGQRLLQQMTSLEITKSRQRFPCQKSCGQSPDPRDTKQVSSARSAEAAEGLLWKARRQKAWGLKGQAEGSWSWMEQANLTMRPLKEEDTLIV